VQIAGSEFLLPAPCSMLQALVFVAALPVVIGGNRTYRKYGHRNELADQRSVAVLAHPGHQRMIFRRGARNAGRRVAVAERHHAVSRRRDRKGDPCYKQQSVKRVGEFLGTSHDRNLP